MTADLNEFYSIYAELEGLPAKAEVEAKTAAAVRASAQAVAEAARKSTNQSYDGKAVAAKGRQQTAHDALESQLGDLARSALSKGSIPSGQAVGTGRSPDLAGAKVLDARLGEVVDDKRKLELELQQLQHQLAREGDESRAKEKDVVTFVIGGIGGIGAVAAGANVVGAIVTIAFVSVMQFRLRRGPSAFVNRQALKRPETAVNRRMQSGVARVFGGWSVLLTVAATLIATALLRSFSPVWNTEFLWRWVVDALPFPAGAMIGLSAALFWSTAIYGVVLLRTGYRRRSGG